MEQNSLQPSLHTVSIENQKKICASAVSEIESITSECIKLVLVGGKRVVILGQNLKLGAFSKQNATFWAEGNVFEVKYQSAKTSFIKKILK